MSVKSRFCGSISRSCHPYNEIEAHRNMNSNHTVIKKIAIILKHVAFMFIFNQVVGIIVVLSQNEKKIISQLGNWGVGGGGGGT